MAPIITSAIPTTDGVKKPLVEPLTAIGKPIASPIRISEYSIAVDQQGKPIALSTQGNPIAYPVRSRRIRHVIRTALRASGAKCNNHVVDEILDELSAIAESNALKVPVFHRVAAIEGGCEIDIGDDYNNRIVIRAGSWALSSEHSSTVFCRNESMRAMQLPSKKGSHELLSKFTNLDANQHLILIAWASFMLAHPKTPSTKYPILVITGDQGSGKSFLCQLLQRLIDPSIIGLQPLPKTTKDLAIILSNSHLALFDNVRHLSPELSDDLCRASSGSVVTGRTLYTDSSITVVPMHGAFILNGIHDFIAQSDFAQRCITLRTSRLDAHEIRSESELSVEFEADLPAIMGGLLDLTAEIFLHTESAEVTHPNRMYDFVKWIAGMESALKVTPGSIQRYYDAMLVNTQLDTILSSPLASSILEFVDRHDDIVWSGTAAELLNLLECGENNRTLWSSEWPRNAISLSKRIDSLTASLLACGIEITKFRGKQRMITIRDLRGSK